MGFKLLRDLLQMAEELEKTEPEEAEAVYEVLEEEVHPKAKERGEDKWFKEKRHER